MMPSGPDPRTEHPFDRFGLQGLFLPSIFGTGFNGLVMKHQSTGQSTGQLPYEVSALLSCFFGQFLLLMRMG